MTSSRGHDDTDIIERIGELVDSERDLRNRAGGGLNADERDRLRSLEQRLDQCWDLLRQRRAKEQYGEDPQTAEPRPAGEVEGYRQ